MVQYGFNSMRVDEGQKSMTNGELVDYVLDRCKFDADGSYHKNGKITACVEDRFGKSMHFSVVSAGFACIDPGLFIHLEGNWGDGVTPKPQRVDNPEVKEFILYRDTFDEWGTITASEQLFTLTRKTDYHPPTLIAEGWDGTTTYKIAYCEPFKPNEPTEIVVVYSKWEKNTVCPPIDQDEIEAKLGKKVCIHAIPYEKCEVMWCNKPYKKYVPKKKEE